jgi:hypothetical protein
MVLLIYGKRWRRGRRRREDSTKDKMTRYNMNLKIWSSLLRPICIDDDDCGYFEELDGFIYADMVSTLLAFP